MFHKYGQTKVQKTKLWNDPGFQGSFSLNEQKPGKEGMSNGEPERESKSILLNGKWKRC